MAETQSVEELRRALAECEKRYAVLQESIDSRAREIAKAEFQGEMMRVSSELAHDLRGPLQIITNSLFLMERKPGDTTYYPKIGDALKQATGILDAFREYYRGHEVTLMKGNINKLIEKSLEDAKLPLNVVVSKSLDPGVPDTMLDLGKAKRDFDIVLKNSIEAMPNGGNLSISSCIEERNITIHISDTGVGIPESVRGKVFIAFGAKKRGGYGLGLAAAKRNLEAMGGSISFESETGKGTIFTITLPIK